MEENEIAGSLKHLLPPLVYAPLGPGSAGLGPETFALSISPFKRIFFKCHKTMP